MRGKHLLGRRALAALLAADALASVACLWAALSLRLGAPQPPGEHLAALVASPLILAALGLRLNLYGRGLRHAGAEVLYQSGWAATLHCLTLAGYAALAGLSDLPRGALLINLPLLASTLALTRLALVARLARSSGPEVKRAVIYGAGEAGTQLAAGLGHADRVRIVGFIDDDPRLWGERVLGLRVYPPQRLASVVESRGVDEVLLAMPSAGRARLAALTRELTRLPVAVKTLPGLESIVEGRVNVDEVHAVAIEDILGRDAVAPDPELLARPVQGRRVLVTGAGGSIGSALCREVARRAPAALVLLDSSEFSLYAIDGELARAHPTLNRAAVLGSVTDGAHLERVMREHSVEVVIHAAAYKHVPLVEANPCEGVYNNVVGTACAASAAARAAVKLFVLVSTDKAVRPTNVMGASKRLAELVVKAAQAKCPQTTYCMVRFGNVLGSSGSVVPLFREQIARGGPVTVTHPDVTRYFMTIPEAAQLVLQASGMARGGEVFILDMGEPVRIVELARRMVELSGLTVREPSDPGGDVTIEFTGLRPGEKLYEELLVDGSASPTEHPMVMRADDPQPDPRAVEAAVESVTALRAAGDAEGVLALLERLVPEYRRARG
jgi:FlaA1/EpsC-like NDP-sugar epimerase